MQLSWIDLSLSFQRMRAREHVYAKCKGGEKSMNVPYHNGNETASKYPMMPSLD